MGRRIEVFNYYKKQLIKRGLDLERLSAGAYLIVKGDKVVFTANTYREVRAFIIGYDLGSKKEET